MKGCQRIHMVLLIVFIVGPLIPMQTAGQSVGMDLTLFEIEGIIEDNFANLTYAWEFDNTERSDASEVRLIFEAASELFLSNVSIKIGDAQYYGEVKPVREAQSEYSEAVENNKSAVLVEQVGDFIDVQFNVEGEAIAQVKLNFEGYLTRELGLYNVDLLTSIDLEGLIPLKTHINLKVLSSMSSPAQLQIPEIEVQESVSISRGREIDIELDDYLFDPLSFNYRLIGAPEGGQLLAYNNGTENFFAYFYAPEIYSVEEKISREYIFTIDTSGSMGGNKIDNAKSALMEMIVSLDEIDSFNVVEFNSEVSTLWEIPQQGNADNIDSAISWIDNLDASGGTNIDSALETSLGSFISDGYTAKAMVFLSDGEPTAGQTNQEQIRVNLVDYNDNEVSIFSVSIGSASAEGLMASIAGDTGGKSIIIEDSSQIVEGLSQFYENFKIPAASGANIQYANITGQIYPSTIGNVIFNGTEVLQVGTFIGELNINLTVSISTGVKEYSNSVSEVGHELKQIERIWAIKKIDHLLSMNLIQPSVRISEQIINMALYYNIVVTGYTAMIVVIERSTDDQMVDDPYSYPEVTDDDRGFDNNAATQAKYDADAPVDVVSFVLGLFVIIRLYTKLKLSKLEKK